LHEYFVYIMTNISRTLYIGMTNNLERRVWQHKEKSIPGFTHRYNLTMLVYFESYPEPRVAFERERELKGWLRARKLALIEEMNPDWLDLSARWFGDAIPERTPDDQV
jgi:putative endonuclease